MKQKEVAGDFLNGNKQEKVIGAASSKGEKKMVGDTSSELKIIKRLPAANTGDEILQTEDGRWWYPTNNLDPETGVQKGIANSHIKPID